MARKGSAQAWRVAHALHSQGLRREARGDRCLSAENVLFLGANKPAIAFSSGKALGVKVFQNLNAEVSSNAGSISECDHCESTLSVLICQRLSKRGEF